jgi:hypothetical protein
MGKRKQWSFDGKGKAMVIRWERKKVIRWKKAKMRGYVDEWRRRDRSKKCVKVKILRMGVLKNYFKLRTQ